MMSSNVTTAINREQKNWTQLDIDDSSIFSRITSNYQTLLRKISVSLDVRPKVEYYQINRGVEILSAGIQEDVHYHVCFKGFFIFIKPSRRNPRVYTFL